MSTKSDAHDGNYSVGSVIEQAKCFLNVLDASYSFLLATITDWRSPARSVMFLGCCFFISDIGFYRMFFPWITFHVI